MSNQTVENFYIDELQKEWEEEPRTKLTEKELYEIFPQAKKFLKKEIEELKITIDKIMEDRRELVRRISAYPRREHYFWNVWTEYFYDEQAQKLTKQLIKKKFILKSLKPKSKKETDNRISNLDIQYAKDTPIEQFYSSKLDKRGNKLWGACELHNDKTPSFVIYTQQNSFWCYGCQTGGDAITYIQKLKNLDFINAIKFILNL